MKQLEALNPNLFALRRQETPSQRKRILNYCILVSALLGLSSCSIFSPVKTETSTNYLINVSPQPPTKKASSQLSLLVTQPETRSIYDTTGIAYTNKPYQIGYFVKSTWAEPPTQMLQPLIIQTLQRTHYFYSVGSLSNVGQYNYILNTQLIQLQQDFSIKPHYLHFVLRAQIINASTNQLVAAKEFSDNEIILQNTPYSGVAAANRAAYKILRRLAQFCLKSLA